MKNESTKPSVFSTALELFWQVVGLIFLMTVVGVFFAAFEIGKGLLPNWFYVSAGVIVIGSIFLYAFLAIKFSLLYVVFSISASILFIVVLGISEKGFLFLPASPIPEILGLSTVVLGCVIPGIAGKNRTRKKG